MATLMQRRIGGGGGEGKGVIGDTALPEGRERERRGESLLRTGNADEMEERDREELVMLIGLREMLLMAC